MNIFNLFFNVLLRQNFMINLLLGIIFVEISIIFFQEIFKTQISKRNHFLYLLINTIGLVSGKVLGNHIYGYSLMLITSIAFMIFVLKLSTLKVLTFFSIFLIFILNIQFYIFKAFGNLTSCQSFLDMVELPICAIISIVLMTLIGLTIRLCLRHFKPDNLFMQSLNQYVSLIIAVSGFNLLVVYAIFFCFFEIISQNIFYLLTLDLYFYFSLKVPIHLCYSSYVKQKINNLKLCNKTILSLHDDTRAFKHDFHNIIQAIGGYILTNDMEGLKKYYSQISKDCMGSNNLAKLNPELINNPAIYNIIADKYHLASSHDIQINLDILFDLNELNVNIYQLTRILGILLDNAIEASDECPQKNINIVFKQDDKKQMFIIENTYNNKQICIDKIFEKDYTTKPHNTGLGLWEVKKILRKNNNLNLHTSITNDYFSQQLEIYSA